MSNAITQRSRRPLARRDPDVIELKPVRVVKDVDADPDAPFWRVALETIAFMLAIFVFVKMVLGLLYIGEGVPLAQAFAPENSDAYLVLFAVVVGKWRLLAW